MKKYFSLLLSALLLAACVGHEQEFVRSLAAPTFADWILSNGRVLTLNDAGSTAEAVAIKDGLIIAVGSDGQMRRWRGPNTREINLGRRTVIPGLNDAHIHATAGCLTWNSELHWERLRSLSQGMQQIEAAARKKPAGSWIVVAGGWMPSQFTEKRLPTRAELDEVAPNHPVYIQILEQAALLNSAAMNALGITRATPDPPGGRLERDQKTRELTGYALGAAWKALYATVPRPPFAEARPSLRACFRELNRVGITSVSDVQSEGVDFGHRRLLDDMARSGELSVRINFYFAPEQDASQMEQYKRALAEIAQLKQTEMFRFAGFMVPPPERSAGELTRADAPSVSGASSDKMLRAAVEFFVAGNHKFRLYAAHDERARQLLDILESMPEEHALSQLRIGFTPMEGVSSETVARLKKIGAGIIVQSRLALLGETLRQFWSKEQIRNAPPLGTIQKSDVPLAAGSGGFRSSNYSPMLALWWLITGKSIAGTTMRDPDQNLTRVAALRAYTQGAPWFTGEEARKGSIEPGKLADLVVLNEDYLTVSLDRIPELESMLTMVAGRIVYAAGPFARFGQR